MEKVFCNRCNSEVEKSELEEYAFQCMNCDEDLYGFEVHSEENVTEVAKEAEAYDEEDDDGMYCIECGEDKDFAFLATKANGNLWRCRTCDKEFMYKDEE